ncbi:MAG: hypothetical protein HY264_02940 [Chloroflexi bacterium]|nr:hypothetical protein [Chloroflexota bacterium]
MSTKQFDDGYTLYGREIYAWLQARGTPVYTFVGRTYGRLEVYRIRATTTPSG